MTETANKWLDKEFRLNYMHEYNKGYYSKNKRYIVEMVACERCLRNVQKCSLSRHQTSKYCSVHHERLSR
jgi:hypothetical protein